MNWKEKKASEDYYADFPKKLIGDYVYGNPRTTAGINFFLSEMFPEAKNILDVGCGIGWSSFEMAKNSSAKVIGNDLSENSINTGNKLFSHSNLTLKKGDILQDEFIDKFNIISFLDVFEHVPENMRLILYEKLNNILQSKFKILITCPTVYHQDWLRKNNPEGLQPVDENITLEVLNDFAKSVGGSISYFSNKSIWHTWDYLHCVISKGFNFEDKISKNTEFLAVERPEERKKRVKDAGLTIPPNPQSLINKGKNKLKSLFK